MESPIPSSINHPQNCPTFKAELLQEGIFFVIHLLASDVLLMKKLENEKTKPTFIISVLNMAEIYSLIILLHFM